MIRWSCWLNKWFKWAAGKYNWNQEMQKTPFAPFQLKFINIKVHRWHGRYWIGKMFILSIELKGAKHFLFTHAAKLAKVIMRKNKLDWTWTKVNKKWTEFSANIPVSCIILTQFTLRMSNYLFKSVCCALPPLKQIDLIGWINQLMLISAALETTKKKFIDSYRRILQPMDSDHTRYSADALSKVLCLDKILLLLLFILHFDCRF